MRGELRTIIDQTGRLPGDVLSSDKYFTPFALRLPQSLPQRANRFNGLTYNGLDSYATQFNLRPIRNIIVKQNFPKDDTSIYAIFNRLNTGGINLTPQEIRTSLYHSDFYDVLYRLNVTHGWRTVLQSPEPDLHMKDVEVLLRSFALLTHNSDYAPSMTRFLNQFSKEAKRYTRSENSYFEDFFLSFLVACSKLPEDAFINRRNSRFNIALFEAVFTAVGEPVFRNHGLVEGVVDISSLTSLEADPAFQAASQRATTNTTNLTDRLNRARILIRLEDVI
jgi:hypothetical protein